MVKGEVTAKILKGKSLFIVISLKSKIRVVPKAYKTVELGDIVQIEILSNKNLIRKNVVALGKI